MKAPIYLAVIFLVCFYSQLSGQIFMSKHPMSIINDVQIEGAIISRNGVSGKMDVCYEVFSGRVTASKYTDKITRYAENGNVREIVFKDKTGRVQEILIYKYNTSNLLQRITKFHPTGRVISRTEYKYNANGLLIEQSKIDPYENIVGRIVYAIDTDNNSIFERHYYSPEKITRTIQWKYEGVLAGKLLSVKEYRQDTLLKYRKEIKYDGELIQREVFYADTDEMLFYYDYYYDHKGRLVLVKQVLPDAANYKVYEANYNELGLLFGEINYLSKGRIQSYYIFEYF